MTSSFLRWFQLFLGFLLLSAPVSIAWAGDAYKPTPATASPARPSKSSSDNPGAASDDTATDAGDGSADTTEPAPPPKVVPPRPAKHNAGPSSTDTSASDDTQGPAAKPASQASDPDRAERALWEEKARKAEERVAAAQARLDQAQLAYTSMRMRSYPSGDSRATILKEIDDAKAELAAAQKDRDSLEDQARAAGVPPSWVMP
jgi:hypothetical protein